MNEHHNMRVKICCIKSVDEARMAIDAGAAALGFVSHMPSGPGIISDELIAGIASKVPPPVETFLLTCRTDPKSIIKQHKVCRTAVIQLCDYLKHEDYAVIRKGLPGVKIVQVVHVMTEAAVNLAESVSRHVDAVLLDSGNPGLKVKELGGTGRIHDWSLSRKIRERLSIPVFLAGGLKPDNVCSAIKEVGPFGIDVCSGVRTRDKLDILKLSQFFNAMSNTKKN